MNSAPLPPPPPATLPQPYLGPGSGPTPSKPASIPAPAAGIKWGADLKKLAICVGLGTALWFTPPPAGVATNAWHLLSIFLATIAGIITTPLPLGAVAMLGLGASMMTNTLSFAAAFSAFANEVRAAGRASSRAWRLACACVQGCVLGCCSCCLRRCCCGRC